MGSLLQVAGGTDFIRKTMHAFLPDTVSTFILLDLHCYDCFPALAALEDKSPTTKSLEHIGNILGSFWSHPSIDLTVSL